MRLLAPILPILAALPATACEEFRDLRRETIGQLFATMADEEADPLTRILAFEDLRCSSLGAVRDRAHRAAAATEEPSLKSEALRCALSSRSLISIDLLEGGRDKPTSDYVARVPTLDFPVHGADAAGRCISLWSAESGCHRERQLAVSGREVDLIYDTTAGTFRFNTPESAYGGDGEGWRDVADASRGNQALLMETSEC